MSNSQSDSPRSPASPESVPETPTEEGTFACPYCGRDQPHPHTQAEIDAIRVIARSSIPALVVAKILLRKVSENKGYVSWAEQQYWWAVVCGKLLEEIMVLAQAEAFADSLRASLPSPVPETPHQQGIRGSASLDVETARNEAYEESPGAPVEGLREALDEIESFAKVLGRIEYRWERDDVVQTYDMEEAQKDVTAARSRLESIYREQQEVEERLRSEASGWQDIAERAEATVRESS